MAPTILRSLDSVISRLTSHPKVGITITKSARDQIDALQMTTLEFLDDLNRHTVAEYQENEHLGEKKVNVAFYGQSTAAFTVADRDDPEHLVLVSARVDPPHLHQRRRQNTTVHLCSFEVVEGKDSGYDLLTEFYGYYRNDLRERQRYEQKEDMLKAGLFVLEQLEQDATELVINYRQTRRQAFDDILVVEVLSVKSHDRDGIEAREVIDDEIIHEWLESLNRNW